MLHEIYDQYNEARARNAEQRQRLERLINKHTEKLHKLEKESPSWLYSTVYPLANQIMKKTGWGYSVFGPFGLCARTSVYFFPGVGPDLLKDENYGLTLQPNFDDGKFSLLYETGETRNEYMKGSIGELNGMNNATAPLPDDLDAIIGILRENHHEGRK